MASMNNEGTWSSRQTPSLKNNQTQKEDYRQDADLRALSSLQDSCIITSESPIPVCFPTNKDRM